MTPQAVKVYIRTQGIIAAIINTVINPLVAWLGNPKMEFMSLSGSHSLIIDTAATCIILSLLVALFATAGVRRDLKAGRVTTNGEFFRQAWLLSRLPKQAWALGLMLGFGAALVLISLMLALFHALGIAGLAFALFALFKALYTALLAFIVTRWVILRQLLVPQI